jgi:hypothetical protein
MTGNLAQFTMPPSTLRLVADVAMGTFVVIRVLYLVSARYEKRSVLSIFQVMENTTPTN